MAQLHTEVKVGEMGLLVVVFFHADEPDRESR